MNNVFKILINIHLWHLSPSLNRRNHFHIYFRMYIYICISNIKDQLGVKQTKVDTLGAKKREEWPRYKPITNWIPFKLQTQVNSTLIEYPIHKALCHICTQMNATGGNIHVWKKIFKKYTNLFLDLFILKYSFFSLNLQRIFFTYIYI